MKRMYFPERRKKRCAEAERRQELHTNGPCRHHGGCSKTRKQKQEAADAIPG